MPYRFAARSYQAAAWEAMDPGPATRALLVWHRRSGKDTFAWNFLISASQRRVGTYYYIFPTLLQGRRILWDGLNREGMRFLSHVPEGMIVGRNEAEMRLELSNGSALQVLGTDYCDALVGTNPVGLVFSEYSIQNPRAWDLTRPILRENKGWAIFVFTPRGKNHAFRLWSQNRERHGWYCSLLTVDNTRRDSPIEDGTPVLTPDDILHERQEGMDEDLIQQEFFCSFLGGVSGAYYARQLQDLEEAGRIADTVEWVPELPVDTFWDLGIGDATAIWFTQDHGRERYLIDYYENSGEGLPHYIKTLKDRPYIYGRHVAPHDIEQREFTTGLSRRDAAWRLGIYFDVAPKLSVDEGVDACRRVLPRCRFNKTKCAQGLDALWNYHKDRDEKLGVWKAQPVHDWSSHAADAFRVLATAFRDLPRRLPQQQADLAFDPRNYAGSGLPPQQAVLEYPVFER